MAEREAESVSKVGRPSMEEKQRKLTTKGKDGGKKLSEERLEKEERRRLRYAVK